MVGSREEGQKEGGRRRRRRKLEVAEGTMRCLLACMHVLRGPESVFHASLGLGCFLVGVLVLSLGN